VIKFWYISVIFIVVLPTFVSQALAQTTAPSLPDDPTARTQEVQGPSPQQNQPQLPDQLQSPSSPPLGTIVSTVTDVNDGPVLGATVVLQGPVPSDRRTVATNGNGFFEIDDVEPGIPYHVSISATGFADWASTVFILDPGQYKILNVSKLQIEEVRTTVTVSSESSNEMAIQQVKIEEKQRGLGIIPNFFEVYGPNPAPLSAKLKFSLAFRFARDPFSVARVAVLAGIGQATNTPNYVQGAKGFGERFSANYASSFTQIMVGGAVLPSLLHQDPRYFYQGTGTKKSRAVHTISNLFITKGDNGISQPNYSSLGGDLASAAVSTFYYPGSNRGAGLFFQNFGTNSAAHLTFRLLEEFVFHRLAANPHFGFISKDSKTDENMNTIEPSGMQSH
jgi:hypothetical protein